MTRAEKVAVCEQSHLISSRQMSIGQTLHQAEMRLRLASTCALTYMPVKGLTFNTTSPEPLSGPAGCLLLYCASAACKCCIARRHSREHRSLAVRKHFQPELWCQVKSHLDCEKFLNEKLIQDLDHKERKVVLSSASRDAFLLHISI